MLEEVLMRKGKSVSIIILIVTMLASIMLVACTTSCNHTHEFTFTVSQNATCTSEGSKHGVCSCGETMVVSIPKTEHTVVYGEGKDATCVEAGNTGAGYCTVCNAKVSDGEIISKLGHSYGEWEIVTASTEIVKGEKRRWCERCGRYEYAELPLAGHTYIKGETVAPSCDSKGYTVYHCTDCKDYYIDDFLPALEHTYSYYSIASNTCNEESYDMATCDVCGFTACLEIHPATGHSFGEWEVFTPCTCTQNGEETRKCQYCGETESRELISIGHDYVETIGEEIHFTCSICGEISHDESKVGLVNEIHLYEQPNAFEFYVLANGTGDYTEEYIRANLCVYNTIYVGTEVFEEKGLHNYSIEKISSNRFRIYVDSQNLYESSYTYSATVQSALSFEEYKTKKLTFTIDSEEKTIVEYNDEIKFLAKLERQNPGYNASEPVFDAESGLMYVTVWKTDGIEIGDILFIGDAENFEEIATLETEGHFAKVCEILPNDIEEYILVLGAPDEGEIFNNLDVYYEGAVDFSQAEDFNDQVAVEVANAFVSSEDFNKFLAASEHASQAYFAPRGLRVVPLTETELAKGLDIKPNYKIDGHKIIISIKGKIERTVELDEDDIVKTTGKFYINFTASLEIEFDVLLSYKIKKVLWWDKVPTQLDFCLTQKDTFKIDFEIGFDVSCSNLMSNFVYYDGAKPKTIHIASCHHVKRIKDESKIKKLTLDELEKAFKDSSYHCCKTCKPDKLHNLSTFVLNTNSKVVHTTVCPSRGNIAEGNFEYSKESLKTLIDKGYTTCGHCHPENNANFGFGEYLTQALSSADFGETLEKIKKWTNASDNHDLDDTIYITKMEFSISGPISVYFDISLVIDFELDIILKYNYESCTTNQYTMHLEWDKMQTNHTKVFEVLENELTLSGSMNAKIGLNTKLGLTLGGLSNWINVGMYIEGGFYSEAEGILHKDFLKDEFYAAAYFEAGVYVEVGVYYRFLSIKDEIKIEDSEIPLKRLGYDTIYYNYENEEFSVELTEKTYVIDLNEILVVKYYDLKEKKTGTILLTETSANGIDILFECENDNISWSGGVYSSDTKQYSPLVITVKDGSPCEIEEIFRIIVIGNSDWRDYKKGSVSVQLDSFEIEFEGVIHDVITLQEKQPTCTVTGLTEGSHCERCGEVFIAQEVINALGHVVIVDTAVEPTCTLAGLTGGSHCERCGETLVAQEVIGALGHVVIVDQAVEPTCTLAGLTEGSHCDRCSEVFAEQEIIDALGHNYGDSNQCGVCDYIDTQYFTFTLLSDDTYEVKAKDVNNIPAHVVIPSEYDNRAVTEIGWGAFSGSDNLRSIVIPNSIRRISAVALAYCNGLTSVNIPDSVTFIDVNAFDRCYNLTSITVDENNAKYKDIEGNLYSKDGKTLIQYAIGKSETSFIILDNVTHIGSYALAFSINLTTIVIPDSIISIGDYALYHCDNLASVVIGEGVVNIGKAVFYYCERLTNIEVNENNKNYKDIDGNLYSKDGTVLIQYVMGNTAKSFTVPDRITTIGDYALAHNYRLESFVVGNNVISIGERAFYNTYFSTIVIGGNVTSIGSYAFSACYYLTSVFYSGTVDDWQEITIGEYNEDLTNATRYYYSEQAPTEEGNFWHYDENGEIVVWGAQG